MRKFLHQLGERKVLPIAGAYVVIGWVLVEALDLLFDAFDFPAFALQLVIIAFALLLPVVLLLAWSGWLTTDRLQRLTGRAIASDRVGGEPHPQSIAVLPFADLSPQQDHQYFSDGLAEEILGALSLVPELRVAGRTSSFSFRGADLDLRKIGRELNVAAILEGSVRTSADRFRIRAQIINAADGFQLWSETFDRALKDIFAVQEDISMAVVDALKVTLLGEDQAPVNRGGTDSTEAFMAYLKGRHCYNEGTTANGKYYEALEHYREALNHDPGYADAHVGIGEVWVLLVAHYLVAADDGWPQVRKAATRALEHEPDLAEAHVLLGRVQFSHDFDWAAAEESFRRALVLNPGSAEVMGTFAWASTTRARALEGARIAREVVERDRLSTVARRRLGFALMLAGKHDASLQVFELLLDDFPDAETVYLYIGAIRLLQGDKQAAFEAFSRETQPYYSIVGQAVGHGALGRNDEARRLLDELQNEYGDRLAVPYAWIHAHCGDFDAAFASLDRAIEARDYLLAWLRVDPLLEPLKADPRFDKSAAQLRLPQEPRTE